METQTDAFGPDQQPPTEGATAKPGGKNKHAAALGSLGASKGGRARAEKLSPEERSAIASDAAAARWAKQGAESLPKAAYGSPTKPLRIADLEIPCYVLDDERRVLVQGGMIKSLGMAQGTAAAAGTGDRLAKFSETKGVKPFVSEELADLIKNPIKFRVASGATAYGYEATALVQLCDAVLAARRENRLHYQQAHIADQCEILVRALAKTGIVALVDEATGYQEVRARNALAEILEAFISEELRKWVRTFPAEFYREMFRLRGWDYSNLKPNSPKPLTVGKFTDDLVYKRLAPGVRDELRKLTPRDERGFLKTKLHRRLSENVGHPKLREHLAVLVALMQVSKTWEDFMEKVNMVLPRYDKTLPLPLQD